MMVSPIENCVDASNKWGSSLLTYMQAPHTPLAGVDDWPLASPSALCAVTLLYLIGVVVSRGRGIVLVVVGRLCSFPLTT